MAHMSSILAQLWSAVPTTSPSGSGSPGSVAILAWPAAPARRQRESEGEVAGLPPWPPPRRLGRRPAQVQRPAPTSWLRHQLPGR